MRSFLKSLRVHRDKPRTVAEKMHRWRQINQLLKTKDKIIEKLKESNEFYSSLCCPVRDDDELFIEEDGYRYNRGGKKAREVKKEVELLEKELQ